ncbi:hypothetical protein T10_11934 [Trichinella papuae]|uniref:Uncharacterized protein n=1 Tax=Trichinella papuae TaxID=268474 RepID=A0A0V1MRF7_9BILA|nr:hypothetical protein T10_11934 [Trichinella papuae]
MLNNTRGQAFPTRHVPEETLGLRTAAKAENNAPVTWCNCTKGCQSTKCTCRSKELPCSSACHNSATCTNK